IRWAETTSASYGIPNSSSALAAASITGQSESEPITTPTTGCCFSFTGAPGLLGGWGPPSRSGLWLRYPSRLDGPWEARGSGLSVAQHGGRAGRPPAQLRDLVRGAGEVDVADLAPGAHGLAVV